jgi:hypothetical protein
MATAKLSAQHLKERYGIAIEAVGSTLFGRVSAAEDREGC